MFKKILGSVVISVATAAATAGATRLLDRKNMHLLPMTRSLEQKLLLDGNTTGFYIVHTGPTESTLFFKKDKMTPMKEIPTLECQVIMEFLGEYLLQQKMAGSPEQIAAYQEHMENVARQTGLVPDEDNEKSKPDDALDTAAGYM